MNRELCHDHLSLPDEPGLKRKKSAVEIWHNFPDRDELPAVVLSVEWKDGSEYVDLLPSEARALAYLLMNAAEHQERRAARANGGA